MKQYELRRMILLQERHRETKALLPDRYDWLWFDNECPEGLTDSGKRFEELKPGEVWTVWNELPIESVIEGRYYSIYEREAYGTACHIIDLDHEAEARAKLSELRLLAVIPEWRTCLQEAHRFYEREAQTGEDQANYSYFSQWAARFKAAMEPIEGDS